MKLFTAFLRGAPRFPSFKAFFLAAAAAVVMALFMAAPAVASGGGAPLPAEKAKAEGLPPRIEYGRPEKIALLTDRRVKESSGLAFGRRNGLFWTHNDSGDGPYLYAFDGRGKSRGRFIVEGAHNRDWEDICYARLDGCHCLIVADTGNNNVDPKQIDVLYVVEEPLVGRLEASRDGRARLLMKIPFLFSDGPHDCEAVAWDPARRSVILISKRFGLSCRAYEVKLPSGSAYRVAGKGAPRPKAGKGSGEKTVEKGAGEKKSGAVAKPLKARPIARLKLFMVTGMDLSPGGRRLVAVTYMSAFEFTRAGDETWGEALERPPGRIEMPYRRQGESICYGEDGKSLFLTSEGLPAPLFEVKAVKSAEPAGAFPQGAGEKPEKKPDQRPKGKQPLFR